MTETTLILSIVLEPEPIVILSIVLEPEPSVIQHRSAYFS